MEPSLILLFLAASAQYHLPEGLLSALCYVESTHNVAALNPDDGKGGPSMGVCQVKIGTARLLGFKGTSKQLLEPKTNIKYAAAYLSRQLSRYDEDKVKAIGAYNSGTYKFNKKGVAINSTYIRKVLQSWEDKN